MKTQRGLTVVIATLVLLLLSLSITLPATSSSAPPEQRRVVLTVRIVDGDGKEITAAHISVFQGEQHLGQGDTDARGIAQMDIVVNTDRAVVLALEVSKPGMETKPHILKLGTNFPMRPPIEDITLKPGVNRSEVVVTVKVVDNEGRDIIGALVNVYKGVLDAAWFASPPLAQDTTGANGSVTFKLPLRAGEIPDIRLSVSMEDMADQRRLLNLRAGFPTELPTERFVLIPRAGNGGDGFPSANIRVNVKDGQGNNLEGALVALTSREQTPSQRSKPHAKSTGPDGSATVAIELMSLDPVEYIGVTVSKPGYKEFKDVMEVNNKWKVAVGKTFDYAKPNKLGQLESLPIILEKLPDAAFEVKVTVLDGDTNNGVPDAEVILDGPDYATKTTDRDGVAILPVGKTGTYAIRISQDNYRSLSNGQVHVRPDPRLTVPDPFRLVPKRTRDEAQDTIEITVLGKESLDADSKTAPLEGAVVSDGRGGAGTDKKGQVILHGAYEITQQVTVTAKGYRTATKNVPMSRPFLGKGNGNATFTLEPELSDSRPIRLVVEVRDAAEPHKLLNQANVYLQYKGKEFAGEKAPNGEAIFTLTDNAEVPLSKLRSGFHVYAKAINYKLRDIEITTPEALQPSLVSHRETIFLERDWDPLVREVESLQSRVYAWKYGKTTDPTQIQQFIEKATSELQDAHALASEFDAEAKAFPELTHFGSESLCTKVANLQLNIRSCESKINTKASELEQTLQDASARAPKCSSPAEAELLRASYRKAIQLLGEIGKLRNQAVRDHDDLSVLPAKASAARRALAQMKDKAAALQTLALAAKQNESNATAYINRTDNLKGSSTSVQFSLKAELAVLTVKVEGETGVPADLLQRINSIQRFLATPTMVSATPLPPIVSSAPIEIARLEESATAKAAEFDRSVCQVITLDEAVEGIKKQVDNAGVEVAFANDIPKLADVCSAKAARGASTSTGSDAAENKPDDQISTSTGPTKDKQPPAVADDPEIKIAPPSKPNPQDTSSGGFWEAAKAGKKKVDNAVTNKSEKPTNPATTGETSENKSGTNTATNKTGNKPTNPASIVEELPEDRGSTNTTIKTNNKTNNPATTAEENSASGRRPDPATNKTGNKTNNPSSTVEEIPEDRIRANPSANQPTSRRTAPSAGVEEIPEDAVKTSTPPATQRGGANPPTAEKPDTDNSSAAKETADRSRDSGGTTTKGGIDLSGTWVGESKQDGYPVKHLLVLKRTAANEWEGTWQTTGGAPFTERAKPASTEPTKIKVVADGNGKGHYFNVGYSWTYDFTYKADQIVLPYSDETGPVSFSRQ
jgi:hypothetical protein